MSGLELKISPTGVYIFLETNIDVDKKDFNILGISLDNFNQNVNIMELFISKFSEIRNVLNDAINNFENVSGYKIQCGSTISTNSKLSIKFIINL